MDIYQKFIKQLLYAALFLLSPVTILAQEPYAVLSDNNSVLTFYYDGQKESRSGMGVGPFQSYYDADNYTVVNSGWYEHRGDITSVVFDASFADCSSITSTSYWFYRMKEVVAITGLEYLNTSRVTDMWGMFYGCSSLTSLDLSHFNTTVVTDMEWMFANCSSLTSLDLSSFHTPNVTDVDWMFYGCSALTTLDVSNFDTSNVTSLYSMFSGCSSLTSLDLRHFNTSNVNDMTWMFRNCATLKDLDLSHFDTSNVTAIVGMFDGCAALTTLDLSSFETSKVESMRYLFYGCSSLISLNISKFNTSEVEDYMGMFDRCSSIAAIQAGSAIIPTEKYTELGNPNLLVYVNEAGLAPQGIQNVVINGVAREIILTDPEVSGVPEVSGNYNFFCPTPFTAQKISYSHTYNQQSGIDGECRGWETIALPFTVQTITHRVKGTIAPFGAPLLGGGAGGGGPRFWLCELGRTRFENATTIEANKPYIISMPQNQEYLPQYNLGQDVITFAATNVTVPATAPLSATAGQRAIHANFTAQPATDRIYTMNVSTPYDGHAEGSVFVPGQRAVRPFEAYTTSTNGARYIELFGDEANGIDDLRFYDLRFDSDGVYDLSGRRIKDNHRQSWSGKRLIIKNGKVTARPF